MAAPTTLRTQLTTLLNLLWDQEEAGTARAREWVHDSVGLTVNGRNIVIQADIQHGECVTLILRIKRLP